MRKVNKAPWPRTSLKMSWYTRMSLRSYYARRIEETEFITIKIGRKFIPQQAKVPQGVPHRLRPRIFLTLGTTRVVGRQSLASAAFTPEEIRGTHFQRLSRPQDTWFYRWEPRKIYPVTSPRIDPRTFRLVAHCLNHCATPGPLGRTWRTENTTKAEVKHNMEFNRLRKW